MYDPDGLDSVDHELAARFAAGDETPKPIVVNERVIALIGPMINFARTVAVMLIVWSMLAIAGGAAFFIGGLMDPNDSIYRDTHPTVGCLTIPLAAPLLVAAVMLWRWAGAASRFLSLRREHLLESMVLAGKSLLKFLAIANVALFALGLLVLAVVLLLLSIAAMV